MPAVVEQRISAELSKDLRTRWAPAVAADLELQEGGPDEMPGRTSTSRPRVVGAWRPIRSEPRCAPVAEGEVVLR